jgi:hypothetical protein
MPAPLRIGDESETPGLAAAPKRALWSTAPAWRNLTIGSCLLTSLAISAPIVLRPQAVAPAIHADLKQSCTAQLPGAPDRIRARVTGFVSEADVLAATRAVEAQVGAQISPTYLPLRRVSVMAYSATSTYATMAALPEYLTVKIGDVVEVNSRYRDPTLPCHFIPWMINRIDHPA